MHQVFLWNHFLKEKAGRTGRVFVRAEAGSLASHNLSLALVAKDTKKNGQRFMEEQPKENISNEASGT